MVQSPSWAANWFAASQEIPRISRNPKVHYRIHKCPPPVPILGQPNPVHIPTSHLLEIRPSIIHPSTPRSPHWSPSLRFPHQDPIHPPLLTHTRHMPRPISFFSILSFAQYWVRSTNHLAPRYAILILTNRNLLSIASMTSQWRVKVLPYSSVTQHRCLYTVETMELVTLTAGIKVIWFQTC